MPAPRIACFAPRWLPIGILLAAVLPAGASAQDRLIFKDNHVQEGKVVGMNGSAVLVNLVSPSGGPVQLGYELGLLRSVEAAPPANFQAGMSALAAGEWDQALTLLKPVADQFRGLPTRWAHQAVGALGDIYLGKNDVAHAEAAYREERNLYPGRPSLHYEIGQARLALARSNPAVARQQLDSLTKPALANPTNLSPGDDASYGQAFFLLGQLKEKSGDLAGALEAYLRTVTLFYQDGAVTARAQQAVDALHAAHKDLAVP